MPPKKVIGLQSQTDMRPNWTADAQAYLAALRSAVVPEFLSMNLLMAGMVPTVTALRRSIASADDPTSARFWFVMSMGLLVGFVIAYPMNWWLVANHMKHGMIAVRPVGGAEQDAAMRHAEKSAKAHPAGMSGMADGPDRQKWRATRPPGRGPARRAGPTGLDHGGGLVPRIGGGSRAGVLTPRSMRPLFAHEGAIRLLTKQRPCDTQRVRYKYSMRCYFLQGGHIQAVQELPGLTDDEAVEKARILFSERSQLFEGFEVWDRTRFIIRYSRADQRIRSFNSPTSSSVQ